MKRLFSRQFFREIISTKKQTAKNVLERFSATLVELCTSLTKTKARNLLFSFRNKSLNFCDWIKTFFGGKKLQVFFCFDDVQSNREHSIKNFGFWLVSIFFQLFFLIHSQNQLLGRCVLNEITPLFYNVLRPINTLGWISKHLACLESGCSCVGFHWNFLLELKILRRNSFLTFGFNSGVFRNFTAGPSKLKKSGVGWCQNSAQLFFFFFLHEDFIIRSEEKSSRRTMLLILLEIHVFANLHSHQLSSALAQ